MEAHKRYNRDGLRVVAVAYREFSGTQENFLLLMKRVILAGYITFLIHPKNLLAAIQSLYAHGVTVKVLTGDNEFVTQKVCREIGIGCHRVLARWCYRNTH
jgi:Mg2+-importing ATPase